jgi:hypothetical protein
MVTKQATSNARTGADVGRGHRFRLALFLRRWLSIGAVVVSPGIALALDYSAGKTPEQLFASDCSACHPSPEGLAHGRDARSLTGFLHQHYTTKVEWAAVLANYLVQARAPQPLSTVQGGSEDATKGNERVAKSAAEILKSKLRGYAIAGEKAKPPIE